MNVEYEKTKENSPAIGDLFRSGIDNLFIRLDETSSYLDKNTLIRDDYYLAMAMDGTIWSVSKDTSEVVDHTLIIKGEKEC